MIIHERCMRFGVFNARWLAMRLQVVSQMAQGTMVMGICKIWARNKNDAVRNTLNEPVEGPERIEGSRGYGWVELVINPLTFASQITVYVIIQVRELSITVLYIGSRAVTAKEEDVLRRINKISSATSVVMGDLDARCSPWENKNNPGGKPAKALGKQAWMENKTPKNTFFRVSLWVQHAGLRPDQRGGFNDAKSEHGIK